MREFEIIYRVCGEVWDESKAHLEADAYQSKEFKVYKTERGARNYMERFAVTDDVPMLRLYRRVEAWDGAILDEDLVAYKDTFGMWEAGE